MTLATRGAAVAQACAHDLNNELTVILNAVAGSIELMAPGHPARPLLLELRCAAQRCAWKAAGLLNWAARNGARPGPSEMEEVINA